MKVWRLYVNDECVGTYGDGSKAMSMAIIAMQDWFSYGYTAEQCEMKHEEY